MIETRRLRYLVTSVRCGSFRATATAFGVNQSSVSRQIRQLEHEIGVTLFTRHSSGVTPTLAGRRMAEAARRFMEQLAAIGVSDMVSKSRLKSPTGIFSTGYGAKLPDHQSSFLYTVHCA